MNFAELKKQLKAKKQHVNIHSKLFLNIMFEYLGVKYDEDFCEMYAKKMAEKIIEEAENYEAAE